MAALLVGRSTVETIEEDNDELRAISVPYIKHCNMSHHASAGSKGGAVRAENSRRLKQGLPKLEPARRNRGKTVNLSDPLGSDDDDTPGSSSQTDLTLDYENMKQRSHTFATKPTSGIVEEVRNFQASEHCRISQGSPPTLHHRSQQGLPA